LSLETLIILFLAGCIAGVITALTGGSSLITFPALIAAGLPPVIANASNFVTVLPANLSASIAYRRQLTTSGHVLGRLGLIAVAGGLTGCFLLIQMSNATFEPLVPWLLLTATLALAFGKRTKMAANHLTNKESGNAASQKWISWKDSLLIFVISVYGGFFGGGLGILMLAGLTLIGFVEYHSANALKNLLNGIIGILGVLIFTVSGMISWPHAVVLTTGSTLGGYFAIRISHKINGDLLTHAMIGIGFALSAYYL